MNIIQRNLFNILCSGAFDQKVTIEPMSPFKWRRLLQVVEAQNVVDSFAKSITNCGDTSMYNIPEDILQGLPKTVLNSEDRLNNLSIEQVRMHNIFLNRKLKNIIERELKDEEASVETIDLLEILIHNINIMLNKGLSLNGIIQLGTYLRRWGHKVDFVKIERWLNSLHMKRMAQLQGSILITIFHFEQDELPFVEKIEKRAERMAVQTIKNQTEDSAEEWHFRQSQSGFVQNNSKAMRRNIHRSMRYYRYAPLETVSSLLGNIGKSLSEIEE